MIFCLIHGELSVQQVEFHQRTSFTNLFSLSLPQICEMESPRITFNNERTNLIVYNPGGYILSYKWKMATKMMKTSFYYTPCVIKHQFVDDDVSADCLSLEQQKQFEEENNRKIAIQKRKTEVLEIIGKLKNEIAEIKERNDKLPEKFRLNAASFEIDERITDDLEQRTQQKFKAIRNELQRKVDKIRTHAERMEHLYLDDLEHWPITLAGFRYDIPLVFLWIGRNSMVHSKCYNQIMK